MDYIAFLEMANKLKKTKRSGWLDRNIAEAESVADHSWRVALMAMVFSKKIGIDSEKAVKMALVHDLAEAITGDISRDHFDSCENNIGIKPSMSKEQKSKNEEKAMEQISSLLDEQSREEIVSLWKEFEERETKTSVFVKDLDRLDCMMQAIEYKRAHPENKLLDDFYLWYKKFGDAKNPEIKKMIEKILKEFEETMKEK